LKPFNALAGRLDIAPNALHLVFHEFNNGAHIFVAFGALLRFNAIDRGCNHAADFDAGHWCARQMARKSPAGWGEALKRHQI
jgi:hypothetical protein